MLPSVLLELLQMVVDMYEGHSHVEGVHKDQLKIALASHSGSEVTE